MRQNFFSCLTSQCFYMERADCGKCTANNSVCDTATLAMTGTCQAQGTNRVRIYSDCLYDCDCGSNRIAVEAQAVTVNDGDWIYRDWMRCLSDPPPP